MKDGRFETQAEIFKALLDKVKIKRETWPPQAYIHLVGGALIDELGVDVSETRLNPPHEFLICEEPKPKKKVTLYRLTTQYPNGAIFQSMWCNDKSPGMNNVKVLNIEEKTIEVDDV